MSFVLHCLSRVSELTCQDKGEVLQVGEQEVLAGPQVAHGGSRCVGTGAQLVDHLKHHRNCNSDKTFQSNSISVTKVTW